MNGNTARSSVPWAVWTMALTAVAGHLGLLLGVPLGPWLLPAAATAALALNRPRVPVFGRWPIAAVVAVAALAITWGSVATLDRSWDGLATWTANARWLAVDGTLAQPYFRDPAVLNYGRGYPLLQPLLLAQGMSWLGEHGARVLFPLLWLLLVGTLAGALRRTTLPSRQQEIVVLGLALVPILVEPGGGSAESGFADLLVAAVLLLVSVAMVENRALLSLVAGLLLPLTKNEGTVYSLLFVVVAYVAGRRRAAVGIAAGSFGALSLWAPLQQQLLAPDEPLGLGAFLPALLGPAVLAGLGVGCAFATRTARGFARATSFAILALAAGVVFGSGQFARTAIGHALQSLVRLDVEWSNLLEILGGGIANLVFVRKLGLTFAILIAAWVLARRRGGVGLAGPPLWAILSGHVAILAFLACRPYEALDLFLREGLVRYMAQWIGVCWLAIGLLWLPPEPVRALDARAGPVR